MIEIVKLSSRGQLVIPEKIRKELNLSEGTRLVMIKDDDRLMLERESDFQERMNKVAEDKEKQGWMFLAMKGMDAWAEDDFDWGKYYETK